MSAQTVFLDAYVVSAETDIPVEVRAIFGANARGYTPFNTEAAGVDAWGKYIGVSAERCRGEIWEHDPATCSYHGKGSDQETFPACSCGLGKVAPEFASSDLFKEIAPYCLRVAFGLVFPSPLFEVLELEPWKKGSQK